MSLPTNLADLSSAELVGLLQQHVFETNLLVRALMLSGVSVSADLVDRQDIVYPQPRPEIIMVIGRVP